jgi:BirA family biotin operon repressor/biotin-[acetyl-CoA-carboxylase] ligase
MPIPLATDVQERLATDRFGQSMRGYEEIGSTNTEAAAWAREGAAEGSVVVAEHQTEGRGRHGRTWAAGKGQNLTFSTVLRPPLAPDRLGLVTLAAGVAVAEAVDDFVSPHRCAIKWPNDVLLEGRKTCGMLLEGSFAGSGPPAPNGPSRDGAPEFVILGIGLNVNQVDFPDALADTATSLTLASGRSVPRAPLLARLLQALEARYDALLDGDDDRVRAAFRERMDRLGEPVTLRFTGSDRTVSGTIRGITPTGALRLATADGEKILHAGEVTSDGIG